MYLNLLLLDGLVYGLNRLRDIASGYGFGIRLLANASGCVLRVLFRENVSGCTFRFYTIILNVCHVLIPEASATAFLIPKGVSYSVPDTEKYQAMDS